MKGLLRDLRVAARTLRATPILTLVMALSMMLGIGVSAGIFSIVNSLMLKPLPVPAPQQLVALSTASATSGSVFSIAVFEQLRLQPAAHDSALAYACCRIGSLRRGATDEPVTQLLVSDNYFATLGVRPHLGRFLDAADERSSGSGAGVAGVISYGLWQRLGADSGIVGQSITIDRVPIVVRGVAPHAFFGLDVGRTFDIALPISAQSVLDPAKPLDDWTDFLNIWLRLPPGRPAVTMEAALRTAQPQIRAGAMPTPSPSANWLSDPFTLAPAAFGTSALRDQFGRPTLVMLALVLLVLMVACANLANLLLARGIARRHEFSVRMSLGATRGQLMRQLLVESLMLGGVGAVGGLIVATWASRLLAVQFSTATRQASLDLSMDWRVLGFTSGAALVTAIVCGLAPAVRATRVDLIDALRDHTRMSGRSGRLSQWAVIAQVAAAIVLVVSAGLFVRTFDRLAHVTLGFNPGGVTVAVVTPTTVAAGERNVLYHDLVRAAAAVPGVADAGGSLNPPLVGTIGGAFVVAPAGSAPAPQAERIMQFMDITPGWFAAYGTSVLTGRDFDEHDNASGEPVMIVNQAFVRRILRQPDGVDTVVSLAVRLPTSGDIPVGNKKIVGVVADAAYRSVRDIGEPTIYLPLAQRRGPLLYDSFYVALRSHTAAPALPTRDVDAAMKRVNANLTVRFRPLSAQVHDALARDRVLALLAGFFGLLALLLGGLGLYGVTTYEVTRQRPEIGIRLALGATRGSVLRLVLTRASVRIASGVAIGVAVSLSVTTFLTSLLYGLEPHDPQIVGSMVLLLVIVALGASWIAAARAARVDPAVVLRQG